MGDAATSVILRRTGAVLWGTTLGIAMGCGDGGPPVASHAGSGGGGGAGGAESISPGGGPPCGPTTHPCEGPPPCDPDDAEACDDRGDGPGQYVCQTLANDCSALEEPLCVPIGSVSPHCGFDLLACTCLGDVRSRDCAGVVPIAPDPTFCSGGTFACGPAACRLHVEVCVAPAVDSDEGTCVDASDLGCAEYGIADCRCLVDGGRACAGGGELGAVFLVDPP